MTSNLFVANELGHPAFVPSRTSARSRGDGELSKPKPPEKPILPYMRYSRKVWESVKITHPDGKLWDIGKMIGKMWRDLPDIDKQVFIQEYEVEKLQYNEAMRTYQNSPAYQQWLAAKHRGFPDEDTALRAAAESKISIQPDDDDDTVDMLTVKHVATARFRRNHLLMAEIFSDAVLPDVRSVVTTPRLTGLKRHVELLTQQIGKLQEDLEGMEDDQKAKLKKFMDSAEEFRGQYAKECEKKIEPTEDEFATMVEKARTELMEHRMYQLSRTSTSLAAPSASAADTSTRAPTATAADTTFLDAGGRQQPEGSVPPTAVSATVSDDTLINVSAPSTTTTLDVPAAHSAPPVPSTEIQASTDVVGTPAASSQGAFAPVPSGNPPSAATDGYGMTGATTITTEAEAAPPPPVPSFPVGVSSGGMPPAYFADNVPGQFTTEPSSLGQQPYPASVGSYPPQVQSQQPTFESIPPPSHTQLPQ